MKTFFCALMLASTLIAVSGQNFLGTLNGTPDRGAARLNIHDSTFPAGEILVQIVPVPEPAVWAVGGLGVFAYLVWKRRK